MTAVETRICAQPRCAFTATVDGLCAKHDLARESGAETFGDMVARLALTDADPSWIARQLLSELGITDERAVSVLFEAVRHRVVDRQRDKVKKIERREPQPAAPDNRPSVRPDPFTPAAEASDLPTRAEWMAQRVWIPSKDYIRWGEATVADHEERIAYLGKHLAGVRQTMEVHQRAVEAVVAAGVSCLDEISDPSVIEWVWGAAA